MNTVENTTCRNTMLPAGIINLDYSEKQRLFHFDDEPQKYRNEDWITLKAMSWEDAIKFCEFMDKKYVNGRLSGILPELSVVKLEMELFFELKNVRRKMEHEMRKYIDTFKQKLTESENLNISDVRQRSVYLLTSDGHRDSVNLQHCAMDDEGLKKILIEEMSEIGQFVIEDTIDIKHSRTGGWILFKYNDYDDDVEDGKCGFFKLNVV